MGSRVLFRMARKMPASMEKLRKKAQYQLAVRFIGVFGSVNEEIVNRLLEVNRHESPSLLSGPYAHLRRHLSSGLIDSTLRSRMRAPRARYTLFPPNAAVPHGRSIHRPHGALRRQHARFQSPLPATPQKAHLQIPAILVVLMHQMECKSGFYTHGLPILFQVRYPAQATR